MTHKLLRSFLLLFLTAPVFAQQKTLSDSLVHEGIRLHDEGKYEEALVKFDDALQLDKKNGYAFYEKANTYIALQEYKKAIELADEIIDHELEPFGPACSLKGNALDMTGKSKQAIKVYRLGISKSSKPDYMLHFNLAIALLGQKETEAGIAELIKALDINPNHSSSHLYLGLANFELNLKVKTLLPLYFFLLLEPDTKRSKNAWDTSLEIAELGVEKKSDDSHVISINAGALEDEFKSVEMLVSFVKVMQNTGGDVKVDSFQLSDTTVVGRFYRLNEYLFSAMSESDDRIPGNFWWDFYGNFFIDLYKNGHTKAFSYYIALSSDAPEPSYWFEKNEQKVDAFASWYENYWKGK